MSSSRDDTIPYYNDDPVLVLKGVGKKTSELLQEMGMKKICNLKEIDNPSEVDNLPNSLSTKKLTHCWNEAKKASPENAPKSIDHRASSNPYRSKFGDNWEMHLQSSPTFSNSAYICHYIEHMMTESARIMKDTIHENTWMVYHDALSIMTSKNTKEWMRQKGYLQRWILPSSDLYNNLPIQARKAYQGKPVGNSPEFMPLDTHLNQDLHTCHDYHATITQHLNDDDPRKFDGSTPKRLTNSYLRLYHPETGVAPTSNRILQDVTRVLSSLEKVLDAEGCIIDETIRTGRRRNDKKNDDDRNGWGGSRTKLTQEQYLQILEKGNASIHTDALTVVRNITSTGSNNSSLVVEDDECSNDVDSTSDNN